MPLSPFSRRAGVLSLTAAVLMGLPDLGYPLVVSAVLALGWGLARAVWAIRILRTPTTPVSTPSTDATTQMSLTNS